MPGQTPLTLSLSPTARQGRDPGHSRAHRSATRSEPTERTRVNYRMTLDHLLCR
jgi:hypothetical protein